VVVVPTIVPLGADLLSAHFFTFYFAIISAITPPVGLASLAASGLAGGNFLQTGLKGFRLAFAGFVLPYMIIYNPIFTWDTSNFLWFGSSFAVIIIAITTLSALMYNTFITRMAGLDRLLAALVTIIGFTYIFVGGSVGTIQSLGWVATLLTLFSLFIFRQKRNAKAFF
jgi:TRAP-type uncharacterized transport system fused permease subunit